MEILSRREEQVMVALWDCGRAATRREIAAKLPPECRWADTTLLNFLLRLEKIPKPDDAADALAIAICHGHSAGSYMGRSRLEEAIARSKARDARRMAEIERRKLEQRG